MKLNMREHGTPGCLITFCGLDGCGKTTIIRMLESYLSERGLQTVLTKQPTNSVRQSEIFRTYMDKPNHDMFDYRSLSLLAASDRVQHSNKYILPMLKEGRTVISDRYFYSCLANLRARGYKEDKWIYEIAECIPKPDLAFFFDIDVETAVERVRQRPDEKLRYIDMALQYSLKKEYVDIAEENGGIIINTSGSVNATFERVKLQVEKYIAGNPSFKGDYIYASAL